MKFKLPARAINALFHPLLMPTLGLFILLHSGSYVSLLDPAVKKALLIIIALGTLVFPLLMLPIMHFRKILQEEEGGGPSKLARFMVLVLFVMTWIYFRRLPLSPVIHAWVLAVNFSLILYVLLSIRWQMNAQLMGLGTMTGMVLALAFRYGVLAQGILLCLFAASGLSGSATLVLARARPSGLIPAYFLGLATALLVMLLY